MPEKFREKYRTTSIRKPRWDYGSYGAYFIIICTKEKCFSERFRVEKLKDEK